MARNLQFGAQMDQEVGHRLLRRSARVTAVRRGPSHVRIVTDWAPIANEEVERGMACLDASLGAPYRPRPFEVGWSRSEVSEMCPKGSPNSGSHSIMPKPTKTELTKYRDILKNQLASLKGDVGSMRDEALRASDPTLSPIRQTELV